MGVLLLLTDSESLELRGVRLGCCLTAHIHTKQITIVGLPIYVSIYLSICLSIDPSIDLFAYMYVYYSVDVHIHYVTLH